MASLQAVVHVAVHVGRMTNVDLFHQGLYHFVCRVSQANAAGDVCNEGSVAKYAVPHLYTGPAAFSASTSVKLRKADTNGSVGSDPVTALMPGPQVVPDNDVEGAFAFRTRTVLIRYTEEEVDLDDIAEFRLEQAADALQPLLLEVDLMFADVAVCGGEKNFDPEADVPDRKPVDMKDFVVVSCQQFRIHIEEGGVHAYCPAIFDECHFCQVGLMVHASVVDYRLRVRRQPAVAAGNTASTPFSSKSSTAAPPSLAESLVAFADAACALQTRDANEEKDMADEVVLALWRLRQEFTNRLEKAHEHVAVFLDAIIDDDFGRRTVPLTSSKRRWSLSESEGTTADGTVTTALLRGLVEDLGAVSADVFKAWRKVLATVAAKPRSIARQLRGIWLEQSAETWAESIFNESSPAREFPERCLVDCQVWRSHEAAAKNLRQSSRYLAMKPLAVEDMSMAVPQNFHPVMFVQRYSPSAGNQTAAGGSSPNSPTSLMTFEPMAPSSKAATTGSSDLAECPGRENAAHVVVLVHGFQGNSYDMRLLRNNIALLYPGFLFLCSSANEEDTEGDIHSMGEHLADEVTNFVKDWCPGKPEATLGRLTFVAHSIGGLIVRSALPYLDELQQHFHAYISLSTPHLGYVFSERTLFNTGLWVARKLRASRCLEQLAMSDEPNAPEKSFLYRLSGVPGLQYFKHIVLVSSYQDQYAPFESARIEATASAASNAKLGSIYQEMLRRLLEPLEAERIVRLDVNFFIPETNLDTVIGRAAHIQFIESQQLMQMFVRTHGWLFE
eukprot:TRINITY_DN51362_c0_g2_i1.p1 TRINITY_DN51362_c0_g2~~TRINITY_DN51362_c0_g2_i1.p1  ORF type:complete len:785 (+),score=185.74 TRINITY_DN51362_c0_g2_i1:297-2651(+)